MLYDYFRESRYSILLDFASVIYTKKLELSLDRKHAMQQLKLVSADGAPVPVTFRLSNNGEVRIGFRIPGHALMRRRPARGMRVRAAWRALRHSRRARGRCGSSTRCSSSRTPTCRGQHGRRPRRRRVRRTSGGPAGIGGIQ